MSHPVGNLTGEHRRHIRVPMQQEIRVRFDGRKHEVVGALADLSVGGMSIRCGGETSVGSTLGFEFKVPGGTVEVRGEGSVVWQRPGEGDAGEQVGLVSMGVKFMALAEADLEEVERIVRAEAGLKTELHEADAEISRLQLAAEEEKTKVTEQLGAMWTSLRENALERGRLEDQLRTPEEPQIVDAEERFDSQNEEEEVGPRKEALRGEIEALEATVAELESHDARDQLRETTFLWEAAEQRIQQLSRSLEAAEQRVEELSQSQEELEPLQKAVREYVLARRKLEDLCPITGELDTAASEEPAEP